MKSNRIYMHKALPLLSIVIVLFSIYVLAEWQNLTGLTLADNDEKRQNGRLATLDPPCRSVSGTVLNVTGQFVTVQGADSPCTISLLYVKGDLPAGLVPGKTVIMRGEFNKGLFNTDNVTITGGTPWTVLETPPQPVGLIDHMIFFIAYWLL
jgi:cytochrome c-type biogenesis protein CcmE